MKKQFISVVSEKAWRVSQHGLAANMKTLMKNIYYYSLAFPRSYSSKVEILWNMARMFTQRCRLL